MKKFFLFAVLFITLAAFSQNTYQQGYFITNDGTRTECLIKNIGWKNSPESFDYKLSENGEVQQGTMAQVKEFSVADAYTFRRFTVQIDRSVNLTDKLNSRKEPEWATETLYLRLLAEGKASLYEYDSSNIEKYFFTHPGHATPEQLFYKQYRIDNKIYENNQFRGQLYDAMKDEFSNLQKFKTLEYDNKALTKLFREYDGPDGTQVKDQTSGEAKPNFNLKVTAGADYANFNVDTYNVTFDKKPAFKAGVEAEYVFGFNNNKWAMFLNPEVTFYSNNATNGNYKWDVTYNFVEVPLGIRYYMFLNKNSKLFVNAAYALYFPTGASKIQAHVDTPLEDNKLVYNFEFSKSASASFGAGYAFNSFSAQLRYSLSSRLTHNYDDMVADYSAVSLILGYKLF